MIAKLIGGLLLGVGIIALVIFEDYWKEKGKALSEMKKAKADPKFAFFFEDLKEFKDTAILYQDDRFEKVGDCIIMEEFNRVELSKMMAKSGLLPAEYLNACIVVEARGWRGDYFNEMAPFREIAFKHLMRSPKTAWFFNYYGIDFVIYKENIEKYYENGDLSWLDDMRHENPL